MDNIIGKKFNMLTCIKKDEEKDKRYYIFKCDCGNEKSIILCNVTGGYSKSCGCLKLKGNNLKHGGKGTRLYNIWKSIRERCNNPKTNRSKNYFEKNIKICSEWDDFSVFKKWALENGYKDNLTIDRKDNKKGYSQENCRWATYEEQANNKTNNKKLTFNGETKTYAEWEKYLGLTRGIISSRVKKGWKIEDILSNKNFTKEKRY